MGDRWILVVEDNPDHLELTVLTLRAHETSAEIVVARDGAEALDILFTGRLQSSRGGSESREGRGLPAFMLLDLKLPKLSGLEVLRAVRADPSTRLVPVVMLTSSSERSDILACYQNGANSFFRKPVDFAEFTRKLHCLQSYWLDVNQPATD